MPPPFTVRVLDILKQPHLRAWTRTANLEFRALIGPHGTRTSHSQSLDKGPIPRRLTPRRAFSHTPLLQKKKGRAEREKEEEAAEQHSGAVEDPFDFSTLEAGIQKSLDKLKNDLLKLRTGGRFNSETLENVRVQLSKDSKATERLGDLAQVLPKGGRSLMVLVGEKDVSC
jgi:ribosome recycling factor